ncbi:MAG: O-antigen ligase family protein [Nitrobacter sp.]
MACTAVTMSSDRPFQLGHVVRSLRIGIFGTDPLLTKDPRERAARCIIIALLVAPALFVLVELSPTAWAVAVAVALIIANPRGALDAVGLLRSPPILSLIVIAALGAISALWSLEPRRSLHAAAVMASYIIIGAIAVRETVSLSDQQRERAWMILTVGAAIGLLSLFWTEIRAIFATWEVVRTFHKTTFYGFLFAAALLFPERDRIFTWRLAFALLFAVPTLLIGRTSGVNLMILASIVFVFISARRYRQVLTAVCAIYCLLTLAAPYIATPSFRLAESTAIGHFTQLYSYLARMELWHVMTPSIFESFWIGHGADTTRIASFHIQGLHYYDLPEVPSAHNMVFDQWFELGLLGVLALIVVVVVFTRAIRRLDDNALPTTATMFLMILVELSVDHRIWLSWLQGLLVYAAIVSVIIIGRARTRSLTPVLGEASSAPSGRPMIRSD